jgi:transcriptional regulator with XRE-family HTH domain
MPSKKSPSNQALGTTIRRVREERGHTQESFAALADLDRSYYGAIERGEFNLTVDTVSKIAAALGITLTELFKRAKL